MIGNNYWATGITVKYGYAGGGKPGWAAEVSYLDDGFCSDDPTLGVISTEGTLHTRYLVKDSETSDVLTIVINVIKTDAERLGIEWREPVVYYKGDGEHKDCPPPAGWREMVDAQSARLGWRADLYTGTRA